MISGSVSDLDPDWIRIQSGQWIRIWIRIQEGKNGPDGAPSDYDRVQQVTISGSGLWPNIEYLHMISDSVSDPDWIRIQSGQ